MTIHPTAGMIFSYSKTIILGTHAAIVIVGREHMHH
jgi:hypothetical protein